MNKSNVFRDSFILFQSSFKFVLAPCAPQFYRTYIHLCSSKISIEFYYIHTSAIQYTVKTFIYLLVL